MKMMMTATTTTTTATAAAAAAAATYVTECIVCVSGHDALNFSFQFLLLFHWVGVLWPQLSKVLKLVRWAGSVRFTPLSLQRQVVCLLLRSVFTCSSQGRAYTVSCLVQIKVML